MPYTQRSAENLVREGIERSGSTSPATRSRRCSTTTRRRSMPRSYSAARRRAAALLPRHGPSRRDRGRPRATRVAGQGAQRSSREVQHAGAGSLHPRTADRMREFGVDRRRHVRSSPLGLFDFVRLEKEAFCVLSDSGTVQEECCIFGVPTVTMREVTERPETIECGSNMLAGVEAERILPAIDLAVRSAGSWTPPAEYLVGERVGNSWLRSCSGSRDHAPHTRRGRERDAGARGDPCPGPGLRGVGRLSESERPAGPRCPGCTDARRLRRGSTGFGIFADRAREAGPDAQRCRHREAAGGREGRDPIDHGQQPLAARARGRLCHSWQSDGPRQHRLRVQRHPRRVMWRPIVPDAVDLYGRSKLLGEVIDRDNAITLRTSIIGWQLGAPTGLVAWFAAHRHEPLKGYHQGRLQRADDSCPDRGGPRQSTSGRAALGPVARVRGADRQVHAC